MNFVKNTKSRLLGLKNRYGLNKNLYHTFHNRPKKAEDITIFKKNTVKKKVGIVVQGGIKYEDNFTLETLKIYQKYYPEFCIILSTWDNENMEVIEEARKLGVKVVISKFPSKDEMTGWDAVNLQRETSTNGLSLAKETGCEYVLKTRTDQRLYESDIFDFLIKLIDSYPIKIKTKAKGRLISCSMSTFKDRMYNISDMFIFGYLEDVQRYFSCTKDERIRSEQPGQISTEWKAQQTEYSMQRRNEIFFAANYLETCGYDLKWTYEDSDYYRNELFIIVDDTMLDLYWAKYNSKEYRWKKYNGEDHLKQVSFKDWYCCQK